MSSSDIVTGRLDSLNNEQKTTLKLFWKSFLDRLDNPTEDDHHHVVKHRRRTRWKKRRHPYKDGTSADKDHGETEAPGPSSNTRRASIVSTSNRSIVSTNSVAISTMAFYEEFWNMCGTHHPDAILLRFLRARKWNTQKALDMLWNALKWRVEFDTQGVFERGEAALPEWMNTSGVVFFRNRDIQNRPVIASPVEENKKQAVYIMELAKNYFVKHPIETVTLILDLGQFAISNFDMAFTKFMISCLEAYYPESLGCCLILNAPMLFNGIWKMVKPLLDPVVAAKVHFISTADLLKFIPVSHLLKSLGGEDTYKYTYIPPQPLPEKLSGSISESGTKTTSTSTTSPDAKPKGTEKRGSSPTLHGSLLSIENEARSALEDKKREISHRFLELTQSWMTEESGEGLDSDKRRADAAFELSKSWWELEQFLPRNFYHRLGVIQNDGQIRWSTEK